MKIEDLLKKRILLLDGAMGTSIQKLNLTAKDFGGEKFEGCNEYLNVVNPKVIQTIYEDYLKAGADILSTNTFGATSVTLAEYGLEDKDHEINLAAAKLGRAAIENVGKDSFLMGSLGPTNKTISVTSNVSFEELEESYYRQAKALVEGGVDLLAVETIFDTLNAKAAMSAIKRLFSEVPKLPVIMSATIEQNGRMLAGQDIEAFYSAVEHYDLMAVGMNCAVGPDMMRDHIRTLSKIATVPVFCYPNAGLPLEDGSFPLDPKTFASHIKNFVDEGWINFVGGCCGTTWEHIKEVNKVIDRKKVRKIPDVVRSTVSGTENVVVEEDNRPIIVGERTNVIGSRKFKELIASEDFDTAADVGVSQYKKGAQVLDVCLANPDRDEVEDAKKFLDLITKKVRLPIMIDSTDKEVIHEALKRTQGRSIINSLNFEDGTERIEEVMPLVNEFGSALIFGTIDEDKEQAMAITKERKVKIAKRAVEYLGKEWGIAPKDIIVDPLVFPIATGDEKYADSARPTIEAITEIKKLGVKTILGVSNVSFGLPAAGREVLNSVYLYHATKAGLDYAIVNSEKLMRYPSIPDEEKKLAEDLLLRKTKDPVTPFTEFYRGKKPVTEDLEKLPLNERLPKYILEGRKDGLVEDLELARKKQSPLDIINGPLMGGMAEVGKLFNENKLIVSEVLQSAEAMKKAVSYLEGVMEKSDDSHKGKVLIATVKGDVHDIGKNLLEIILKNNGYEVVNLGIKVLPETLITECKKHSPDIVGLSGLLVKSAHMMVTTAEDFKAAGIDIPLIVGGAALTRKFTMLKIKPAYGQLVAYAKDAMQGLDYIGRILEDPGAFEKSQESFEGEEIKEKEKKVSTRTEKSPIIKDAPKREAPDFDEHVVEGYDLEEIFSYINPVMLYNKHLGLKGHMEKLLEKGDPKARNLKEQVDEVKAFVIKENLIKPKAIYKFFKCRRKDNSIEVLKGEKVVETLEFPRQHEDPFLCVSDFVSSDDNFGMFVTSCGEGIMKKCEELRNAGDYLKSHILQILALECAEALAEIVHKKMRGAWGIVDNISREDLFVAKYEGIRVSYGYPACPDLDDQKKIFALLSPEKIGVELTEGMMMEPEASVSALVFYHPDGQYFKA